MSSNSGDKNPEYPVTVRWNDTETMWPAQYVREVFTEKRLAALETIIEKEPESITALGNELHRGYANIYEDVQLLSGCGLVEFLTGHHNSQRPVAKLSVFSPTLVLDDSENVSSAPVEAETRYTTEDSKTAPVGSAHKQVPSNNTRHALDRWGFNVEPEPVTDAVRGDVVWVPDTSRDTPVNEGTSECLNEARGTLLLVLSHDLPDDVSHVTGVPLTPVETSQAESIAPSDWSTDPPATDAYACPWAIQSVVLDAVAGQLGSVTNDKCNECSIATQVYLGPVRNTS